jgi:hypothetical protein
MRKVPLHASFLVLRGVIVTCFQLTCFEAAAAWRFDKILQEA